MLQFPTENSSMESINGHSQSIITIITQWLANELQLTTRVEINPIIHYGPVKPYGHADLGQHWLKQWLVAWQYQAITWTNVDLSSKVFCGIHLGAISQEVLMNLTITCVWRLHF